MKMSKINSEGNDEGWYRAGEREKTTRCSETKARERKSDDDDDDDEKKVNINALCRHKQTLVAATETEPTPRLIRCLNVKVIYFQKNSFILLIIQKTVAFTLVRWLAVSVARLTQLAAVINRVRSARLRHYAHVGNNSSSSRDSSSTNQNPTIAMGREMLRASFKNNTRNTSGSEKAAGNRRFSVFHVEIIFQIEMSYGHSLCILLSISIFMRRVQTRAARFTSHRFESHQFGRWQQPTTAHISLFSLRSRSSSSSVNVLIFRNELR